MLETASEPSGQFPSLPCCCWLALRTFLLQRRLRLKEGDRSLQSQFSPLAALRMLLVKPPFISPRDAEMHELYQLVFGEGWNPCFVRSVPTVLRSG